MPNKNGWWLPVPLFYETRYIHDFAMLDIRDIIASGQRESTRRNTTINTSGARPKWWNMLVRHQRPEHSCCMGQKKNSAEKTERPKILLDETWMTFWIKSCMQNPDFLKKYRTFWLFQLHGRWSCLIHRLGCLAGHQVAQLLDGLLRHLVEPGIGDDWNVDIV